MTKRNAKKFYNMLSFVYPEAVITLNNGVSSYDAWVGVFNGVKCVDFTTWDMYDFDRALRVARQGIEQSTKKEPRNA
jgi:hypothetical protein